MDEEDDPFSFNKVELLNVEPQYLFSKPLFPSSTKKSQSNSALFSSNIEIEAKSKITSEDKEFTLAFINFEEPQTVTVLGQYEKIISKRILKEPPKTLLAQKENQIFKIERNTWHLFKLLSEYRNAETAKGTDLTDGILNLKDLSNKSDYDIISLKKEYEREFRSMHLVIEWLEWTESIEPSLELPTPLLLGEKEVVFSKENEEDLLKWIWIKVRCGKLQEAQDICRKNKEFWRAASLGGGTLYYDPYLTMDTSLNQSERNFSKVRGNAFRNVWKEACKSLSSEISLNIYERAIYGSLSGNIEAVFPLCKTWEDYLWVYYKAMIISHEDEALQKPQWFKEDEFNSTPVNPIQPETVFRALENHDFYEDDTLRRFHIIQTLMILGHITLMFEEIADWVKEEREINGHITRICPRQVLRFGAHLVLYYFPDGLDESVESITESCTVILSAYIDYLIGCSQIEYIAFYTSKLPPRWQTETYANFLKELELKNVDEKTRKLLLNKAKEFDLPLTEITKRTVDMIKAIAPSKDTEILTGVIPNEDRAKIDSIKWLSSAREYEEALFQMNHLARDFLSRGIALSMKRDYYQQLVQYWTPVMQMFEQLPFDEIWENVRGLEQMISSMGYSQRLEELIFAQREISIYKMYIDLLREFQEWFDFHTIFVHNPSSIHNKDFPEKEEQKKANRFIQVAKKLIEIQSDKSNPEEINLEQFMFIKKICIPTVFFLLHIVNFETGKVLKDKKLKIHYFKQDIQAADIIVGEGLHEYFVNKDDLRELLNLWRKSSIELLALGIKDPLGYETY